MHLIASQIYAKNKVLANRKCLITVDIQIDRLDTHSGSFSWEHKNLIQSCSMILTLENIGEDFIFASHSLANLRQNKVLANRKCLITVDIQIVDRLDTHSGSFGWEHKNLIQSCSMILTLENIGENFIFASHSLANLRQNKVLVNRKCLIKVDIQIDGLDAHRGSFGWEHKNLIHVVCCLQIDLGARNMPVKNYWPISSG